MPHAAILVFFLREAFLANQAYIVTQDRPGGQGEAIVVLAIFTLRQHA
jgi:hypothetical protein